MRSRPIGQSGVVASVVGMGACPIGGWLWGGTEMQQAIATIHAALDAGINLIDTAPGYGLGLSEQIIGKAIADRRDRAVISTKCGLVWHPSRGRFRFVQDGKPVHHDLTPASIRSEIDQSLTRLGTDYIDIYQIHHPDPDTPIEQTMATLMDLQRAGKVRAVGVSNVTDEQMAAYRAAGRVDSDQEKYSMLDRRLDAARLPLCIGQDIAVIAYSPMELGLLTGKVDAGRTFPAGDFRGNMPCFSVESRLKIAAMLQAIAPVAEWHGVTFAQLAVAWCLNRPGLTHALVGARTPEQARENAQAGDVPLSDDDMRTIESAIAAHCPDITGFRPNEAKSSYTQ